MAAETYRNAGTPPREMEAASAPDDSAWEALRGEIDELSTMVSDMLSRRAQQVASATQETVSEVPEIIRRNPWVSLAIAGTAGVVIGLAVTRPARRSTIRRLRARAARLPDMASDMADSARQTMAYHGRSMADRLESLADSIANFDGSSANPLLAKAADWLKAARGH